jgi:hypothetical protein
MRAASSGAALVRSRASAFVTGGSTRTPCCVVRLGVHPCSRQPGIFLGGPDYGKTYDEQEHMQGHHRDLVLGPHLFERRRRSPQERGAAFADSMAAAVRGRIAAQGGDSERRLSFEDLCSIGKRQMRRLTSPPRCYPSRGRRPRLRAARRRSSGRRHRSRSSGSTDGPPGDDDPAGGPRLRARRGHQGGEA